MDRLPVFLDLKGKACLVVGGGVVAERKTELLLRAGAAIMIVAPEVNDVLRAHIDAGTVSYSALDYSSDLVDRFWLVIAATDDESVNRRVSQDCARAHRPCNVVDNADLSSFIVPAIVDRSPVVVAIGTGGSGPVLAQQLKARIEAMLPSRIGDLAIEARRWRDVVRARIQSGRLRLRFWQEFFEGGIASFVLSGRRSESKRLIQRALEEGQAASAAPAGEGWIVGAGPGDPDLVTLKAQRLIGRADVILYDRLVSEPILDFGRKDATKIHVGKSPGSATKSQDEINALLVDLVRAGNRVCRLKGGDPFMFGRGGEEIGALAEAGLPFTVVPGVSAALGCAAYAGIPLTYRGVSASVTFATARLDRDLSPDWPTLLNGGHTLCLYMGVQAVEQVSEQLVRHGVPGQLPVAFIERGTTPAQRVITTTVKDMAAAAAKNDLEAPAMVVIGEVVGMAETLSWYESNSDQFSNIMFNGLQRVNPAATAAVA